MHLESSYLEDGTVVKWLFFKGTHECDNRIECVVHLKDADEIIVELLGTITVGSGEWAVWRDPNYDDSEIEGKEETAQLAQARICAYISSLNSANSLVSICETQDGSVFSCLSDLLDKEQGENIPRGLYFAYLEPHTTDSGDSEVVVKHVSFGDVNPKFVWLLSVSQPDAGPLTLLKSKFNRLNFALSSCSEIEAYENKDKEERKAKLERMRTEQQRKTSSYAWAKYKALELPRIKSRAQAL